MQALRALLDSPEGQGLVGVAALLITYMVRSFLKTRTEAEANSSPDRHQVMKATGAAISGSLDAAKISADIERIADASEAISLSVASLARSEESGHNRMLEEINDQMKRLDDRLSSDRRRSDGEAMRRD